MPILGTIASQVPANLPTNSFESIATVTVAAEGSSAISFSSIPSTYKHLQLRGILRGSRVSTNDILGIQFNGDSTMANYVSQRFIADGTSSAGSYQASNTYSSSWASDFPASSAAANIFNGIVIDILDYATASKNRVSRSFGGYDFNGSGNMYYGASLWLSTSTITSITLLPIFGAGFSQYSRIALYGVKG